MPWANRQEKEDLTFIFAVHFIAFGLKPVTDFFFFKSLIYEHVDVKTVNHHGCQSAYIINSARMGCATDKNTYCKYCGTKVMMQSAQSVPPYCHSARGNKPTGWHVHTDTHTWTISALSPSKKMMTIHSEHWKWLKAVLLWPGSNVSCRYISQSETTAFIILLRLNITEKYFCSILHTI